MVVRPGGEYASRPLHFFWLLDCSGSMREGGKIQALNNAIREVIPAMKGAADGNPEVQFHVRAIRFSTGASWHIAEPTLLKDFKWTDLSAEGETDLGQALTLLSEELQAFPANARFLPPVLVLVSDGQPTDDWRGALETLLAIPWGKRAVKQAIAIGQDADFETLRKFVDHPERQVLRADSAEELVKWIKWVSTSVTGTPPGKQPPPPPATPPELSDESIW